MVLFRINRGIEAVKVRRVLVGFGALIMLSGCGGWDTRPGPLSAANLKENLIFSAAVAAGQSAYEATNDLLENRRKAKEKELATATGLRKAQLEAELDQLRAEQPAGCMTAGKVSFQSKLSCLRQGGKLSSEMVAECRYPDGGVQLIMLDDCLRFLSAEVVAVYDASTKPEILVDSQIVRKLNN